MYENYDDVLNDMRDLGLIVETIVVGTKTRVDVDRDKCKVDKDKKKPGWYILHSINVENKTYIVGKYGYFKGTQNIEESVTLNKDLQKKLTPEQKAAIREQQKQAKKRAEAERKAQIEQAAQLAQLAWGQCDREGESPYLARKQVQGHGVRYNPTDPKFGKQMGTTVVPVQDAKGKIYAIQKILPKKTTGGMDKFFYPEDAEISGHFHIMGGIPQTVLLIAEGYATAATIYENTGLPVAVAYNANNLTPVAKALKKHYPKVQIIIAADDDYLQKCIKCQKMTTVQTEYCEHCGGLHAKKNAGVEQAQIAAMSVGGSWVAPNFLNEQKQDIRNGEKLTDFNDLALHPQGGPHLVRAQIEAATQSLVGQKPATQARPPQQGEGVDRPQALSIMPVDEIVERFIYVDDVHGDNVFDTWTKEVVKVKKVQGLLPQFVRWDDVKSNPEWQRKAVYRDQIGFDPTEKDSNIICNRWSGWPTKPNANATFKDCEQLITLIMYLCDPEQNGDDVFNWVMSWLAYPIQNPGAKLDTALVLHGPQGTGKNLFFEAYGKIYGEHFSVITQDTMEDQFNSDWVDRKLFVLADEIVAVQERTHVKNKLKTMVTGEKIRINQKMIAAYPEKNFFNMVFLSNEANPVVLEKRDRRYLVIWTPDALPQDFYNQVREEIENGGIQALHQYLLNWDCGDFKTYSKPPMTKAKQDLILINVDNVTAFLQKWQSGEIEINHNLVELPYGPAPAGKLYELYKRWCADQGERWIKTQRQFLSSIRSEGVYSEKQNHFEDYNAMKNNVGNKRTQFYVPKAELLLQNSTDHPEVKVMHNPEDGSQTLKQYFTHCLMEFNKAWENVQ